MPSPFEDFLKRNSIEPVEGSLPLVHSTKSLNLRELIQKAGIEPRDCDVYNEKLLYFFLGRPSYRWVRPGGTPQDWELPTCFVFDEATELDVKRVLPFDSGAHHAGRYPSYVQNIPLKNFESEFETSEKRIVSAFFGSFRAYLEAKPKTNDQIADEFSLGPLDAEIMSIGKLAGDTSAESVDDRRFSIEIQSTSKIDFNLTPPKAIILPTPYMKDANVVKAISAWQSEFITYDTWGLSLSHYFGAIFLKFTEYCKKNNYL